MVVCIDFFYDIRDKIKIKAKRGQYKDLEEKEVLNPQFDGGQCRYILIVLVCPAMLPSHLRFMVLNLKQNQLAWLCFEHSKIHLLRYRCELGNERKKSLR